MIFVLAPALQSWGDQFKALGASLVTAGLVALVLDRIALSALIGEVTDKLESAFGGFQVSAHGMRSIVVGPFYSDIYRRLRGSEQLTVLQTWSPDLTNLLREAEAVVHRGGQVRIYLLHPQSPFARQRGVDLGPGPDHVPSKIRSDARDVRAKHRRLTSSGAKGSLELYYYNALPAFALYRVDDTAWVGSYWYQAQSDAGSTFVIDIPSPLWVEYDRHLREVHRNSIRVRLDKDDEPELPQDGQPGSEVP
jgi:hypothetical protein